jgi:phenylpyruvate tautomerase PptA (4-oxalocrotonate tautomerase family)
MPVVHIDTPKVGLKKKRELVRALGKVIEAALETSGVHVVINESGAAGTQLTLVRIVIFKRDLKKRRALARAVTAGIVGLLKIPAKDVHIVIQEIKRDQYAVGGVLMSDKGDVRGKTKPLLKRQNKEYK